jgi:hypothetical protein
MGANKKQLLLVLFFAIILKAAFSYRNWEYKKPIAVADMEGIASAQIDAETYNHSKEDLSDLRVVDDNGKEVPYKLEILESTKELKRFEPRLYNLSNIPNEYTEFYLDMGENIEMINKLHMVTPDKNFRRKVEILGSDDNKRWFKIRDDAHIFNFHTDDYMAALTDLNFPDTKRRYLKIIIWNKQEKPLEIERCWVYQEEVTKAQKEEYPFKIASRIENEEKKRTEIILDVVYNNIPRDEITLDFASPGYYRSVCVSASTDAENWRNLGSGVIYRFNKENKNNVISLGETRERYLKILIYNQDDAPLKIDNISIKGNQQLIYFPAEKDKRYYLFYGNPDAIKPIYEFVKLLPHTESKKSVMVQLGKEQVNEDFSRVEEVLEEDQQFIIWPMVAFVVVALGFLIMKSIKRIKGKEQI